VLPANGLDLEELERDLICQALARAEGNKTGAARLLGLSRDTLRYRLEKYGIH
jgi:DNA-binding NtrC family response regulator